MTRRYYPSTRERITRAMDEGVKAGMVRSTDDAPSQRNSGRPLFRAWVRGWWLAQGSDRAAGLPVVDLSTEFADIIAEVESNPPACLEAGV